MGTTNPTTGADIVEIGAGSTAPVAGVGAGVIGSATPANAELIGGKAATANPTNATAGNLVAAMADKAGRLVVTEANVRELIGVQQTAYGAVTTEQTIITSGGAGVFNDLASLVITTVNAAASTLTVRDATGGTTRMILNYPNAASAPGTPMVVQFNPPIPQAAAANNWTIQASASATGFNITAVFVKNL